MENIIPDNDVDVHGPGNAPIRCAAMHRKSSIEFQNQKKYHLLHDVFPSLDETIVSSSLLDVDFAIADLLHDFAGQSG